MWTPKFKIKAFTSRASYNYKLRTVRIYGLKVLSFHLASRKKCYKFLNPFQKLATCCGNELLRYKSRACAMLPDIDFKRNVAALKIGVKIKLIFCINREGGYDRRLEATRSHKLLRDHIHSTSSKNSFSLGRSLYLSLSCS